jgi:hypothetical protein
MMTFDFAQRWHSVGDFENLSHREVKAHKTTYLSNDHKLESLSR